MPPNHSSQSRNTPKISKPFTQSTLTSHHVMEANHPTHSINSRIFGKTLAIVKYVIFSLLGRSIHQTPSPEAKKVKELTGEILAKHDVYNTLCSNLNFTPSNLEEYFNGVAETIFEDGCINWGRLIALLGFSVKVAEFFRLKGFGIYYDDLIVNLTTQFIVKTAETWITDKGGWENVIVHFRNSGQEGVNYSPQNITWFKGILVTATIGLGALFAVTCK